MSVYELLIEVARVFLPLLLRTLVNYRLMEIAMHADEELMTRAEVARFLKVHPNSLSRLRKTLRTFPDPVKVGNRLIRWRRSDVQKWLDSETA